MNISYGMYSKRCDDSLILPSLHRRVLTVSDTDSSKLILLCKKYGQYNPTCKCYLIKESPKLFDMISKEYFPQEIANYVAINYDINNPMLVMWIER